MPDEALITEIENLIFDIVKLGGQNERTHIVPNLTVQNAAPAGLSNFIVVTDNRDGDNILARKVPGVIYSNNDTVNVLFIEGTEPIAFQQGSTSSNSGIWEIVPSTSTDIYYDKGDVGIGKSVAPDASLEILDTTQQQLRLSFQEDTKFVDFTLDTNHDLTVTPSSTGQIILQPTTDSADFFQVLDADGGAPVLNVDSTNEAVSVRTADTSFTFQGATAQVDFFLEGADVGASRTMAFRRQSDTASRGAQNAFLRARAGAAAVQDGDRVGTFNFEAHDGTDYNVGAQFGADIDGAVSANTTPMGFLVTTSPSNGGGIRYRFYITPDGDVAIGQTFTTPTAQLHVDQHDTTGAQPVLQVQQSDISEEIIWYEGESSAASADMSLVDASDFTTPGALLGWIKNKVEDNRVGGLGTIDVWIPFYAIPTA